MIQLLTPSEPHGVSHNVDEALGLIFTMISSYMNRFQHFRSFCTAQYSVQVKHHDPLIVNETEAICPQI